MSVAIWLVVIAWSLEAAVTSIPWFVHAGTKVFVWAHAPGLLAIIGLHAAGTLGPIIAGVSLWRRQSLIACLSLTVLSSAWLCWHIWTFTHLAWVLRDSARVLLSVATLGVVVVYSIQQVDPKPKVG